MPSSFFIFITDQSEISRKISENDSVSVVIKNSKKVKMSAKRNSKGPCEDIIMIREELKKEINSNWNISRGDGSLIVKHKPTIDKIENKYGKGLKVQIWMERPNEKGYGRCKFEVAYSIPSLSKEENISLREKIARKLRSLMAKDLPKEFEEASDSSTVIALRINLSGDQTDGNDINIDLDKNEILKIIEFYRFIDEKLNEWNYSY